MNTSMKERNLNEMEQVNGGGFFDMSDEERQYYIDNSPSHRLWQALRLFGVFLEGFGSP